MCNQKVIQEKAKINADNKAEKYFVTINENGFKSRLAHNLIEVERAFQHIFCKM